MATWSDRSLKSRRERGRSAAVRYSGRLRNPRQNLGSMGRWVLCALIALLVAGMNYLPFPFVDSCRDFLSYCFQPGAAEGTKLAVWADWQPNAERLTAVWQRLTGTGSAEDDDMLAYPCTGRVSSGYGWRYHPVTGQLEMHYGLDIAAEEGTAVQSAGAGTVAEVRNDDKLGLCLIIDHGEGISTEYGHLQSVNVAVGAKVTKGQSVAKIGKTGVTNDTHLHFAVLVNGQPDDPLPKLQKDR